jgi:hypothetical protein
LGGRRQPKAKTKQDVHKIYLAACTEIADSIGCDVEPLYYWFKQIAMAREGCGEPRDYAEEMALRNVGEVFLGGEQTN